MSEGESQRAPRVRPDKVGAPSATPERMLQWFTFEHLADEEMRSTSAQFACVAETLVHNIPPCPERTVALRKLLESKDAAVRAVIEARAMAAQLAAKEQQG